MMNEGQSYSARPLGLGVGVAVLLLLGVWLVKQEPKAQIPIVAEAPAGTRAEGTSASERRAEAEQNRKESPGAAREEQNSGTNDAAALPAPQPTPDKQAGDTAMSPGVGRGMSNVIELLNAGNFDEATLALDALMTAERMSNMSPFERSRLYQLSFNLNMQAENYDAASADIQAALESGGLSAQEFDSMSYQRGQLFVQMEDYAKAADSLELWVARPNAQPNKAAYYLLAAAYYYQDRFDDARDHMETLMNMPGENQEAWYAMMTALYLQDQDYAKAKPVVEKMVELYADPRYREQLSAINIELAGAR